MRKDFMVETSARHVHLSQSDLETLFGPGAELTVRKWLSQPGQFASEQRVDVIGPRRTFQGVSVLGPVRPATQVEVSLTDARAAGLNAPIRESGDVRGSGACRLRGPAGELTVSEGVIAAKRHLHMNPDQAAELKVQSGQTVAVAVSGGERPVVFGGVVVRVSDRYTLAMHIDTDEANAAGCGADARGFMVEIPME